MTKETLQELKDSLAAIMQAAKDHPDQLDQLTPSLMSFMVIGIVDAARQLTRIADKLDERWDFDKEADELATEVNAQLATPAPQAGRMTDALVEAVKELLTNTDIWVCNQRVKNMASRLSAALAAHEKAGSDGR